MTVSGLTMTSADRQSFHIRNLERKFNAANKNGIRRTDSIAAIR
jgi:hypothetical protein